MSTRRERLQDQADRRRGWAELRTARAASAYQASDAAVAGLPLGEPRHPGAAGRALARAQERSQNAMAAAAGHDRMAERHSRKASTIERQLDESIYDDDPDAIARLEDKLAQLLRRREEMNEANRRFRRTHRDSLKALSEFERDRALPHPQYERSNLTGVITRTKQRIERLRRERDQGVPDRLIIAKFASDCASCGAPLERGQQIRYNRSDGARCVTCPTEDQPGQPAEA